MRSERKKVERTFTSFRPGICISHSGKCERPAGCERKEDDRQVDHDDGVEAHSRRRCSSDDRCSKVTKWVLLQVERESDGGERITDGGEALIRRRTSGRALCPLPKLKIPGTPSPMYIGTWVTSGTSTWTWTPSATDGMHWQCPPPIP